MSAGQVRPAGEVAPGPGAGLADSPLARLLARPGGFTTIAEVVPWRGGLEDASGGRTRDFAAGLREVRGVDVLSVTDGAGGRLVASAEVLGAELARAGQPVLIHVTCRDRNRNELAALAWRLAGAGLRDLLILTGDYPHEGYLGVARPVFDLDSVALLDMYSRLGAADPGQAIMSRPPARAGHDAIAGLTPSAPARGPAGQVPLYLGAAVSPYKTVAADAIPQYLKLAMKARAGARFAITQVGYDAAKLHELTRFVAARDLPLDLIAGIYVLTAGTARAFNAGKVPGVSLSDDLLALVTKQATAPDKGKLFFLELAARQHAVARGLGYAGASLSGLSSADDVATVLRLSAEIGDRWRDVLPDVTWSIPGTFWHFRPDPATGLTSDQPVPWPARRRAPLGYAINHLIHNAALTPEAPAAGLVGAALRGADRIGLGAAAHAAEHAIKIPLFGCQDCGDCSLPDIAYLCPESQCVKNQRNGPCGGSTDGECEVPGKPCIWARAYDRLAPAGHAAAMLDRPVAVQDNSLRRTSAWANALADRDYRARRPGQGQDRRPGAAAEVNKPSA